MWDEDDEQANILKKEIIEYFDEETKNKLMDDLGKFDKIILSSEADPSKPYIESVIIQRKFKYNPHFGDDRLCECGHVYYRHFDSYEDMDPIGCKYCGCYDFKEAAISNKIQK